MTKGLSALHKGKIVCCFSLLRDERQVMPANLQVAAARKPNKMARTMRKKIHIKIALIVLLALGLAVQHIHEKRQMKIYKTKEPLLIEQGEERKTPFCLLPAGTTLYLDEAMPEGFCRFVIYANFYGIPEAEEISMKPEWHGRYIAPLWLDELDGDNLKAMLRQFPLTKDDVLEIIKSNGLTRDDLADMARQLPGTE